MRNKCKRIKSNWPLVLLGLGVMAVALGYVPFPFSKRDGNYKQAHLGVLTISTKDQNNLGDQRAIRRIVSEIKERNPLMPPVFQPSVDGVTVQWEELRSSPKHTYRRIEYNGYRFESLKDIKDDGTVNITIKYSGVTPEILRKLSNKFGEKAHTSKLIDYGCTRKVYKDKSWSMYVTK